MIGRLIRLVSMALALAVFSLGSSQCGGNAGGSGSNDTSSSRVTTVAHRWNEAALGAIRIDVPRPPVHARNLWHLSAAMYDAWAAYDQSAKGYLFREKIGGLTASEINRARAIAISYAAYGVLKDRYTISANAPISIKAIEDLMMALGNNINHSETSSGAPQAVGNRIAAIYVAFGNADGSNQAGLYDDPTYAPTNPPLLVAFPGDSMPDPNHWQPLQLLLSFAQNGIPQGITQVNVCPQWGGVRSFAIPQANGANALIDLGGPPQIGAGTDSEFKAQMMEVVQKSSVLSPELPETVDISPKSYGNNTLGTDDGHGRSQNPATGQAYPSQTVKLGDFARVVAEYWADGPNSETPPGHWNAIANQVSNHVLATYKYQGQGPVMDRLQWDVKLYFALNAALHDAAINAWGLKRIYNSVRPISAIRTMATLGTLPLVSGLTEVVVSDSETQTGGRFEGVKCCTTPSGQPAPCVDSQGVPGVQVSCVGEIVAKTWPGSPPDITTQTSGVHWVRAREWVPYQLSTFVTPAFPGYNSGHSTFSRAAAEVLSAFTGSDYFPGGLLEAVARRGSFLKFEYGPSQEVRLQWATYFDASDQAGQSRLFGGIHIQADDFTGRIAGSRLGKAAFVKAKTYFDGTAQ